MKRRGIKSALTAVRSEGGLLPAEFLERLAAADNSLPGLTPADYHLGPRERLGEAINRSWSQLLGSWASFRDALAKTPDGDPATGLTRDRWLLPLFQELGYGRLVRSSAIEVDGKSFAISHTWNRSPIHLLGARVSLDHRSAGVAGAAAASPHSLVQELLNRSPDHRWGFLSNGLTLRILRDHHSLTRQAYVEFDLEIIFDGEQYSEFLLLWLVLHQSRVEAQHPEDCWLERWFQTARDEGVRALDNLREGVQRAVEELGSGFLRHRRANSRLQAALEEGALDSQGYYRELLRLVYRLIFLFVAEDREALLDPDAAEAARDRYVRFYATRRLRQLAEASRGGPHGDLWRSLRLVMERLHDGCPELALPALGSRLWRSSALPHINDAEIANRDLLAALRALCTIQDGGAQYPVNWKNIGSEELGSIYESLLELQPRVSREAALFELKVAPGHERKATSSYYTAPPLVECLLDLSLEPLLDEAASRPNPRQAILDLKVCDPACGSGHFLVAAAHRIARRLAAVTSGDQEASPLEVQHALRQVVGRCLFGVDANPMAVELCNVSLWMEALEPGRPLSFLETHIRCGNSLLGATPELMAAGIPDAAFEALEGDDKEVAQRLKKANRAERQGQTTLIADFVAEAGREYDALATRLEALDEAPDDDIEALRTKERNWDDLRASRGYREAFFRADLWCSAFVWPKSSVDQEHAAPTQDLWRKALQDLSSLPVLTRDTADSLSRHHNFFHWHLAFPQVFDAEGSGGFDLVLGNPPWDTLSPDTKEFFSAYEPQIRFEDKDGQAAIVERLLRHSDIASKWAEHRRDLYATVHFIKKSGRYKLFAPGNLGKGDFNVYRMFAETAMQTSRRGGRAAQLVPENVYNGANAMAIRKQLFERFDLEWLLGFENRREVWFQGIDSRTKFALYSARKNGATQATRTAFNIRSIEELEGAKRQPLRFPISLVHEFAPVALAFMEFDSQLDIDIVEKMYARYPKFGDKAAGPPFRQYMAEVHMGNDRHRFVAEPPGAPVYEGRMVAQYDHRAKGYRSGRGRSADWEEISFSDPGKSIQPQWWIPEDRVPGKLQKRYRQYRIGFCDVASPTNERSLVATLIPPGCIAGDKVPTLVFPDAPGIGPLLAWVAVANSFVMDSLVRRKISLKMSYTVVDSLPFPRFSSGDPLLSVLVPRAAQLCCVGPEMEGALEHLAQEGYAIGEPAFEAGDRERLTAEIDALVAKEVFGLSREELEYLLVNFHHQETRKQAVERQRTRALVLEAYDHLPLGQVHVSMPNLAAISTGAWGTPSTLDGGDLALVALVEVLRLVGSPVSPERVRLASLLVRKPALALPFLGAAQEREWVRVVGREASPLPDNVIPLDRFRKNATDQAWGDAIHRLRGQGHLCEDPASGNWLVRPGLPPTGEGWVEGRARAAVALLSRIDQAEAEQNLVAFLERVEHGQAGAAVS